eukprot:TRINITY_DN6096_c1_g1_i1.p1 TRINITY_DN6096_c1_g1~~TRINITY_DN6096_c1_g1_i1.p1  ORF type:complete len:417 (+),score=81.80 TRINITY_DN6096_c1_g1_i1:402-1652(+)
MREFLQEKVGVYIGFDPTADSLHLGSLLPIVSMVHFMSMGHKVFALVGGATGMIGDPSGRSSERNLLDTLSIEKNSQLLEKSIRNCLLNSKEFFPDINLEDSFESNLGSFKIVNNYEFYKDLNVLSFLRDIGKHFRVNQMINKDSVKKRMDTQEGISFTEFSYQILQAYDFQQLQKKFDVCLQIGGSDQWGNITEGMALCSRLNKKEAHGITLPLLTNSEGQKIGKSTGIGESVWLSEHKTSPYEFYQYFLRLSDENALRFLPFFTFISTDERKSLEEEHKRKPEGRIAQKKLAEHATILVHGRQQYESAVKASQVLFSGDVVGLGWKVIQQVLKDSPCLELNREEIIGKEILNLAFQANIASSKGECKRLIEGGGLTINNQIVMLKQKIEESDLQEEKFIVLRAGKKNWRLIVLK